MKAVGKEVEWKEVSTEKKKNLRTGEVHAVEMTGKRKREGQELERKMMTKAGRMTKDGLEDGETAKNVKWISGDHLEIGRIEMVINVEVEIVI